jgi:uncharacterized protein (DUF302 family)
MEEFCNYGFGKTVDLDFPAAVEKVRTLLGKQGFRVLSTIDLQRDLQTALGITFRRYLILGACNADFAYQAFTADPNIGLLLPCNVIVYETDAGQVQVMAMDPVHVMELVRKPEAVEVTMEVKEKLEAVMAEL